MGKKLIADTRYLCWVTKMNSSERLHKYHFLLAVKMGGLARVEPAKKETWSCRQVLIHIQILDQKSDIIVGCEDFWPRIGAQGGAGEIGGLIPVMAAHHRSADIFHFMIFEFFSSIFLLYILFIIFLYSFFSNGMAAHHRSVDIFHFTLLYFGQIAIS